MLAHASAADCFNELTWIILSIEEGALDDLLVISLLLRIQKLCENKADLVKAVSLPQHILYLLFARSETVKESVLEKPRKYAMLQLLDAMFSEPRVVENYVHDFGVTIKSMPVMTVEWLFNLVDTKETNALGIALILLLLSKATESSRKWGKGVNCRLRG